MWKLLFGALFTISAIQAHAFSAVTHCSSADARIHYFEDNRVEKERAHELGLTLRTPEGDKEVVFDLLADDSIHYDFEFMEMVDIITKDGCKNSDVPGVVLDKALLTTIKTHVSKITIKSEDERFDERFYHQSDDGTAIHANMICEYKEAIEISCEN